MYLMSQKIKSVRFLGVQSQVIITTKLRLRIDNWSAVFPGYSLNFYVIRRVELFIATVKEAYKLILVRFLEQKTSFLLINHFRVESFDTIVSYCIQDTILITYPGCKGCHMFSFTNPWNLRKMCLNDLLVVFIVS